MTGAHAAGPIVDEPVPMPDETVLSGIYAQVLVGAALPGVQQWVDGIDGEWDLDLGYAVAGTVGVQILEGLSVELDALYTSRAFSDYDGGSSTFALMGNLKYTFVLGEGYDLYVAAGVGHIRETHERAGTEEFGGFGYQLIAGASVDVADDVALVGEYRFQNSFSPMPNVNIDTWTHQLPTHALLIGAKLGF